jgi:DNA-binding NarL/FixJ family response regulator
MAAVIRVVVGEDSYLVREGIVQSLATGGHIEVVGAESDYDSLVETVERTDPDVVVSDIRMPPTGTDEGIRLATELGRSKPQVGVVVLSEHAQLTYATELFAANGARRAYILKDRIADPDFLVEVVESVAHSRPMLDPTIVGMLVDSALSPGSGVAGLSGREREVLGMVAEGASNSAIAEKLSITVRAVERHINAIFAKLDLHETDAVNRRVLAALMYVRSQEA